MSRIAAIYLGHFNPPTKAHERIFSFLEKDYNLYIFPVRFLKGGNEVNTRSSPFPYTVRKAMIEAILTNNTAKILPDYTFLSPFMKYLPPIISPYSWMIRNHIVGNIAEETFITYTGDTIERLALAAYRLHPIRARRLEISSSSIKEMLYRRVLEESFEEPTRPENEKFSWHDRVPEKVIDLIKDNWEIIEKFAKAPDLTVRVMGMKFPKDGFI